MDAFLVFCCSEEYKLTYFKINRSQKYIGKCNSCAKLGRQVQLKALSLILFSPRSAKAFVFEFVLSLDYLPLLVARIILKMNSS